jgi:hypothetical protein
LVAGAIYRAATGESGVLRHLVGEDAELIAGAKRAMSFEEFDGAMRAMLNWHD